jgi:hypothetical protein
MFCAYFMKKGVIKRQHKPHLILLRGQTVTMIKKPRIAQTYINYFCVYCSFYNYYKLRIKIENKHNIPSHACVSLM